MLSLIIKIFKKKGSKACLILIFFSEPRIGGFKKILKVSKNGIRGY